MVEQVQRLTFLDLEEDVIDAEIMKERALR